MKKINLIAALSILMLAISGCGSKDEEKAIAATESYDSDTRYVRKEEVVSTEEVTIDGEYFIKYSLKGDFEFTLARGINIEEVEVDFDE